MLPNLLREQHRFQLNPERKRAGTTQLRTLLWCLTPSKHLGHLTDHGTKINPSLIQLSPHQCGISTAETKVKAGEAKEFLVTQCLTAGSGHSLQKWDLSLEIKMLSQQSPSADWSPVMDGGRSPALSSNASTTALASPQRATPGAGPAHHPPRLPATSFCPPNSAPSALCLI